MPRYLVAFALVVLAACRTASVSVSPDRALAIGERGVLTSEVLGEQREYLVYTPPAYAGSEDRYPVLYLLDAETHFHHVTGIVAFLADIDRIPETIVVGVVNTARTRDLTPSRVASMPTSGGAEAFVRFLETELIPTIDERYRTHPYRILAGHSFGGLFAAHVLIEHPTVFDAYLAASPSLEWGDDLILHRAGERFGSGERLDRFLYFTLGNEHEEITRTNEELAAFLETSAPPGLVWSFTHMRDEDHMSTPHRTVYDGLEALFADLALPSDLQDRAAVESHYRALSDRFRFPFRPAEDSLTMLGYRLLGENEDQRAVEVFRLLVEEYPESPNSYDCLGEALETIGEHERALEQYELAVERATAQRHQLLELFVRNRDRLRDRLTGE